ncbi:MAG: glutamine synthetase, partial [Alphaproteobacteria bacterium]
VFAANANAWRRIHPGHYAPIDRSWGHNNRTVSFRIPQSGPEARRLEHRCSSADINPYLAITLILAAMVEGIEQKMTPPPITTGNAYDAPDRDGLPMSWAEANRVFAESDFTKSWLGEDLVRVFATTKEYERLQFEGKVTPLEWLWYR